MPEDNGSMRSSDRAVGELIRDLSDQTARLVRDEVELAKAELQARAKEAGKGGAMFGAAGLFGAFAFAALTAAFILALATAVAPWLAALIVAGAYAAVGAVLAWQGRTSVQQATPLAPEQAAQSAQEDVRYTKTKFEEARR